MIAALLILSIVAVVLLVVAICEAAGSADEREARVYDFPERKR